MRNTLKKEDTTNNAMATKSPLSGSSVMSSAELLRGQQQLAIAHDGEVYLLRVTKQGKLILTK